jgi:hypothetical protein
MSEGFEVDPSAVNALAKQLAAVLDEVQRTDTACRITHTAQDYGDPGEACLRYDAAMLGEMYELIQAMKSLPDMMNQSADSYQQTEDDVTLSIHQQMGMPS